MTTLADFRIIRQLGEGGMGIVLLAECRSSVGGVAAGTRVALKAIREQVNLPDRARERFRRECELGISIRHPNVARVLAAGIDESGESPRPFLVMEYIRGQSLAALQRQLAVVPESLCTHVAERICEALQELHGLGVVHRDIKPSNIMLSDDDQVKLVDLGIAHLEDEKERLTNTGEFVGSRRYAAPEVLRSGAAGADARSDLYSLGVTLFELLTGSVPRADLVDDDLRGLPLESLMAGHPGDRTIQAGEFDARISPFFRAFVLTLISPEPAVRFQSAAEAQAALAEGVISDWYEGRAQELRSGLGHERIRVMLESPFVGRDSELAVLRKSAESAVGGRGQLVLLVGEAGIGKSRLAYETAREFVARPSQPFLVSAACHPGQHGGVGVILRALREALGTSRTEARVHDLLPKSPGLARSLARLMLGEKQLVDGAGSELEAIETGIVRLMQALAIERPVMLLVENLQDAGDALFDSLRSLLAAVTQSRVLSVLTTRPQLQHSWSADILAAPGAQRLQLQPLAEAELHQILHGMGKGREQGYLRAEQACATSRGNPLFLIELAKEDLKGDTHTTQTSATGVTHVPGTVQDVVLSRVARLTAMEREYVDLASVIGVEFSGRLLCAVLSTMHDGSARIIDVLRTLARLERDTGLVRTRGPGFAFEHQLVRDAIYESVSGELRAHLHLAVAHGLEATVAGGARPAPRMAVSIVQHYLAACRPDDAFEYLDPAVEGLIAAHDYDLARAILDDFLRQSDPSDGPSRVMALSRRGVLALTTGTAQLDGHVIDELVVLTRQLGDSRRLRSALQMRAEALVVGRRFQEARDAVAEALTVPAESAGEPSDTQLRGMLGRIDLHAGDIDSARRNLQRVVTEATSPGERAIRLRARGNLAHLPPVTGAPDDSLSMMRACLEEAEALEDDRLVAQALLGLAYLQNGTGDTRQAYAAYQQLLVRTRRVGQRVLESVALSNTASLAFDLGRIAECIELASEALALAGEIRDPQGAVLIRLLQAEVEIWFGGLDESGRRLDALDRELEGSEDQQALSALSLYRGVHHTALGAGEAALTAFDLATQLSQDSQVTERSLLGAARNAALRGDHEGARRRLRTLMETPGAKHHRWVPAAAALIGALSEDVSPAEAHALLRDARDAIPRLLAIRGLRDLVDRGVHGEIAEDLNAMTDELVGGLPAQIDGASLRNHPLWSRATVG